MDMKGQYPGLPITPSSPISSYNLTLKGSFGRREYAQRAMSCIVTKDCRNKSTKQPLNAGFPIWVSRVNTVSFVKKFSQ
jgi:hypothetical protein